MARMSAPRPHTGGPRRSLDEDQLREERRQLLTQSASPERTAALRRVTSGLKSIANRSPRDGA